MREACKNCRFSLETAGIHEATIACRRHAPIRSDASATYENKYGLGAFPRVDRANWCGDWQKVGHVERADEPVTSDERKWDAFWNGWRRRA